MIKRASYIFLMLIIAVVQAWGANCGGATPCVCGDTVTSSYTLGANLACDTGTIALTIGANDITLNLGGFTLSNTAAVATGVYAADRTGTTITNGTITAFSTQSVWAYGGTNLTLTAPLTISNSGDQNVQMSENTVSHAVPTVTASGVTNSGAVDDGWSIHHGTLNVAGGVTSGNGQGAQSLSTATRIYFNGVTFTNNGQGIDISNASAEIVNSTFNLNDPGTGQIGIVSDVASDTLYITNCDFNILQDSGAGTPAQGININGATYKAKINGCRFTGDAGVSMNGWGIQNIGTVTMLGTNTFRNLAIGVVHNGNVVNNYRGLDIATCSTGVSLLQLGGTISASKIVVVNDGFLSTDRAFSVRESIILVPTGKSGIRAQNATAHPVTVYNCTFYGSGGTKVGTGCLFQNAAQTDQIVINSIFVNLAVGISSGGVTTYSYSDFYSNTANVGGAGTKTDGGGNLTFDPLFVSASDFHLQAASPVINKGSAIAGFNDQATAAVDFDGVSVIRGPEMGAYQYAADYNVLRSAISSAQFIRTPATISILGDNSALTLDLSNAASTGSIPVTGPLQVAKIISNANVNLVGNGARIIGPTELGNNVKLSGFYLGH